MRRFVMAGAGALAAVAFTGTPAGAQVIPPSISAYQRAHHLGIDGRLGHQVASMLLYGRWASAGPLSASDRRALGLTATYRPAWRSTTRYTHWRYRAYRTPRGADASASSTGYWSTSTGWAIPARVVACESGGRNLAPNRAGASGYYQVIPATWRLAGGLTASAYQASRAEQDRVAARIWSRGGAAQWDCK